MSEAYIDFSAIKERVSMEQAIRFLDLKLTKREGDQWRFPCPACRGNDPRALSINVKEDKYRCFEDKGKGGTDSIALVAHVKGIRQRQAALILDEHFPERAAAASTAPSHAKALPDGRRDAQLETVHPVIELLGLSAATLKALGGGYSLDTERIQIPLRLPDGTAVGFLGIATREDQSPLLLFPQNIEPVREKPPADQLRKLFRIVG
jgi:hypothetical protein